MPATGSVYRWPTKHVTYCDASGLGEASRLAVDWWNDVPSKMRLANTGCGRARIVIRQKNFRSPRIAGRGEYPPGGRVWIDTQMADPDHSTVDRANVIAHEIGHALGLPHRGGCALMNPGGSMHGRGCGRPDGLFACGPQRRDARALIRRYGGRLGDFDGTTCGERPDGPDEGPPFDPPPPPPPPTTHRVVVQLTGGDDEQRLYLNDSLVGYAPYAQSRTFDLGELSGGSIRIDVFNRSGGYAWGIRVMVDGVERYSSAAGAVGSYGACSNAQTPTNAVVFRTILDFEGDVIGGYRPC